jgi:hypothetical protein
MDKPKIIKKTLPKINIGKMPIMVKSAICVLTQNKHINNHYRRLCNGLRRIFYYQGFRKPSWDKRAAENKIYCFDGKPTTKWAWLAEIKSVPTLNASRLNRWR